MLGLLPFRGSLRRAGADAGHVLRAAVYGCDFGLLMAVVAVAAYGLVLPVVPVSARPRGREVLELASVLAIGPAAVCGVVATHRVTVAVAQRLPAGRAVAVVVASQVIAFPLVELAAGKAVGRW